MSDGRSPCVIGLCGRSGSGKGVVCSYLSELGVKCIDTDKVYAEMTGPASVDGLSDCMKALVAEFGADILADDFSLDRRAMANVVFAPGAEEKLKKLNTLTHEFILAETERRIEEFGREGCEFVTVDAPLLFESGFDKKCDCTVAVTAPDEKLIERIKERDGLDTEAARRRLASQKKADDIARLVDYVIVNDSDLDSLKRETEKLLRKIRRRRKGKTCLKVTRT